MSGQSDSQDAHVAFGWSGLASDLLDQVSDDSQTEAEHSPLHAEAPQQLEEDRPLPSPELDEHELARLRQPTTKPFDDPVFLPALGGVCARFEQAGEQTPDHAIHRLGQHFLQQPTRLHTAKAALGQLLEVEPKAIESSLCMLASSLLHLDKMERYLVEKSLAQQPLQLLAYFDINKFDETPMRVSQEQIVGVSRGNTIRGNRTERF